MKRIFAFITGTQVGLGLMYLLDPNQGRRRRALLRDQGEHWSKRFEDEVRRSGRDLKHRSYGRLAQARSILRQEEASDEVLHERIRSAIGRYTANPGAIDVLVDDGRVILEGAILADEFDELVRIAMRVPGVESLHSRLAVHESADIPDLQGQALARPSRAWKPATRLLFGGLGTTLVLAGIGRRRVEGIVLGTGGGLLLIRAATNFPLRDVVGLSRNRRRLFHFQKSIVIEAPIDEVFSVFSNFENWPRFMGRIHEIRNLGQGRSHWTFAGPAGLLVDWESVITECIPNEKLAWRSAKGAVVGQVGEVRFEKLPKRDATRIHFRLAYYPPGGALGHVLGTVLGASPRRNLHHDLLRFKTLIESGYSRIRGRKVDAAEFELERGSKPRRRKQRERDERIARESLTFRGEEPLH